MAYEPKILLTIKLEGGSLHRGDVEDVYVEFRTKRGHLAKKKEYSYRPLVANEATLSCKLCKEAYEYMTNSKECPSWFVKGGSANNLGFAAKMWKKLSNAERLEAHLTRLCEYYDGKSFTYEILED